MPEYIVSVMPPCGAEPFDIPEWDLDAATATASRYRERGWEACVRARAVGHGRTGSRGEDWPCAI